MPSQAPRSNTDKKREQLRQCELELKHALRSDFSRDRLIGAAEKLRAAALSLVKARFYWAKDAKIKGRNFDERVAKFQSETQKWKNKSIDEILHDYAA
jgi:hypothetical protein